MFAGLNIKNNFYVWIKCRDRALIEVSFCLKSQFVRACCKQDIALDKIFYPAIFVCCTPCNFCPHIAPMVI